MIEYFSFSYDTELNRYIGVLLRYLTGLSPEHQKIWKSKEINLKTQLHPDYLLSSMGYWPESISIFSAFIEEQKIINKICENIGRPVFFKKTFDEYDKPREFSFLIRPTLKEFNDFILLLDKMISDNINKAFFQNEVPDEDEEKRNDGKIIIRKRGTIRILEEWLKNCFRTADDESRETIEEMVKTIHEIRRLRQSPAHGIKENIFDGDYIHKQREIMRSAYKALKTVRVVLQNHPFSGNVEISEPLREGKISSV